uniref:Uncharacterized protein n=1 Tax=Xiphophorus couchianus TaxID=32473 RepID=A0A3B5KQM4_9TELE
MSGNHFKGHEVSCCIKYFIFGFNILFWVRTIHCHSYPLFQEGARLIFTLWLFLNFSFHSYRCLVITVALFGRWGPDRSSCSCTHAANRLFVIMRADREKCGVPFSCCTKDPAEDVINTQCGYDIRAKPQKDYINVKGCVPQFERWLQDNLTLVAGIFIGVALLQIFGICLAQNLVSDIEAVRASW